MHNAQMAVESQLTLGIGGQALSQSKYSNASILMLA